MTSKKKKQQQEKNGAVSKSSEREPALIDAKETSRLCSISTPMLYKLNAMGSMPAPLKIGKLMRWRRKEILRWIDKGCLDLSSEKKATVDKKSARKNNETK